MDLGAVDAATRKHEAIETDIGAYGERVAAVEAVARELEAENYHDVRRVLARRDNVLRLWEYLKELLAARRERLNAHRDLQRLLQEMRSIMDWMGEMKVLEHYSPSVQNAHLVMLFISHYQRCMPVQTQITPFKMAASPGCDGLQRLIEVVLTRRV